MWSLGGTQKNRRYMYMAHKSVIDSNIEYMSRALWSSCWPIHISSTRCDKQGTETSIKGRNENIDKTKGTTNNSATSCSLCASLLFLFFNFIFSNFFAFMILIFFSTSSKQEQTTKIMSSIG
jgi:hypothetical protein